MISKEIPKNLYGHIAKDGTIYDPFGPHFLHLNLHEKLRQDLLAVVTDVRNDPEERKKCDEQKDPTFAEYLDSSIHGGESINITPEIDKKHGHIIENILRQLTSIYASIDPINVKIFEAWYVVMKEGDFHVLHSHQGQSKRLFSGSIYLQIPNDIEFPQGNVNSIAGGGDQVMYKSHHYVTPKTGEVLVWPAWLNHDVHPFRSTQERIMISFNTGIK